MELQLHLHGHYLDMFLTTHCLSHLKDKTPKAWNLILGNKCERLSVPTAKYLNYTFSPSASHCLRVALQPSYQFIREETKHYPSIWLDVLYLEGTKTKKPGLNHEVRLCFVPDLRLFVNSVISV